MENSIMLLSMGLVRLLWLYSRFSIILVSFFNIFEYFMIAIYVHFQIGGILPAV